jgi:hypothetical protein
MANPVPRNASAAPVPAGHRSCPNCGHVMRIADDDWDDFGKCQSCGAWSRS